MRHLVVFAMSALVSGCAFIPTQISLLSSAADGVSYMLTGKTTSDHALSAALDRDCRLFRVVQDGDICIPASAAGQDWAERDGDGRLIQTAEGAHPPVADPMLLPPEIASLASLAQPIAQAGPAAPEGREVGALGFSSDMFFKPSRRGMSSQDKSVSVPPSEDMAVKPSSDGLNTRPSRHPDPAPKIVERTPASRNGARPPAGTADPLPATEKASDYFVVLGSFSRRGNAERLAAAESEGAESKAAIAPVVIGSQKLHRVFVGPMSGTAASRFLAERHADGDSGAWVIPSCLAGGTVCLDPAAASTSVARPTAR